MTTKYLFEEAVNVGRTLRNPAIPSRKKNELRARLLEILPVRYLFQVELNFNMIADDLNDLIPYEPKTKEIINSMQLMRKDLEAARHAIAAILAKHRLLEYDEDVIWHMLHNMNKSCETLDKNMGKHFRNLEEGKEWLDNTYST